MITDSWSQLGQCNLRHTLFKPFFLDSNFFCDDFRPRFFFISSQIFYFHLRTFTVITKDADVCLGEEVQGYCRKISCGSKFNVFWNSWRISITVWEIQSEDSTIEWTNDVLICNKTTARHWRTQTALKSEIRWSINLRATEFSFFLVYFQIIYSTASIFFYFEFHDINFLIVIKV